MKVEVYVVKNYYKKATIEVEVPDGINKNKIWEFINNREEKDSALSDELANASLEAECGGVEIEVNI